MVCNVFSSKHAEIFFSLYKGYGYESGESCGVTTPIEVVDTVPASLPEDFACRIMTPDVYAELGGDLVSGHKTLFCFVY